MRCFLDLDGVLVNWIKGCLDVHQQDNPYDLEHNHGTYWLNDLLKIEESDFYWPQEHTFWANLEWMPDGKDILQLVEYHFKRITILTAPTWNQGCPSGKIDWVKNNMPFYERRMFIGSPKAELAHSGVVLIDDHEDHINKFIKEGGHGILVPRLWNYRHKEAKEVLKILESEIKTLLRKVS